MKTHKSQYGDCGCSYVNTKQSEAFEFLEHTQHLYSLYFYFLLHQMQTKMKATGLKQ